MKRLLSAGAMVLGLALSVAAQQSTTPPSTQSPDTTVAQPQSPVDTSTQQRSAQSFEGKIMRSGDKLVLRENASKTAYQLDDQDKAKRFEGKDVKVMATVDASTNSLHVVDITAMETN
jgi:hypothetical protein